MGNVFYKGFVCGYVCLVVFFTFCCIGGREYIELREFDEISWLERTICFFGRRNIWSYRNFVERRRRKRLYSFNVFLVIGERG